MKLIACLLIVLLIFVLLSTAVVESTTRRVSRKHSIVLEQFQGRQAPGRDWWSWGIWPEWLTGPRRGKSWRQERLWLHAFRRWYHKRVRCKVRCALRALGCHGRRGWRWFCHLLQAWLELVDTRLGSVPQQLR